MNALRLALGTLTILPVRPPTSVDRRTAGRAMVLAPLVGLVLGCLVLAVLWVLGLGSLLVFPSSGGFSYIGGAGDGPPRFSALSALVASALVVALLALFTRGMHLDGLADTADGLGSGRARERALAVMRKGDVGPFGVVTLVLVLVVQVAAVHTLVQDARGLAAIVASVVLSRLALPFLCFRGIPSARPDGLGATVARSVGLAGLSIAVVTAAAGFLFLWLTALEPPTGLFGGMAMGRGDGSYPHALAFVVVPAVVTGLFARRCVRRFGGVTGDVLGACVEVAFTTALLVAAL